MKTCGHSNCGTKSVYLWMLAGFRLHWSVCGKLCSSSNNSSSETRKKTRQNAMPNFFLCQNRNAEIYLCFQFIALSFGIVLSSWNVQHFGTCHCVRAIWINVNITIETRTFIHSYNAPNGKVAAIFHWCVFAIVDCMKRGANNALSPIPFLSRNWH